MDTKKKWDVFIAYASEDISIAQEIAAYLTQNGLNVFIDKSLVFGDYSEQIPIAQSNSSITLALISHHLKKAIYQQEEIQHAIQMRKQTDDQHVILPVYLEGIPKKPIDFFYGLISVIGMDYKHPVSITELLNRILKILDKSSSEPEKIEVKLEAHPLHLFPRGPMVKGLIDIPLIRAYANAIPMNEGLLWVDMANAFRKEADQDDRVFGIDSAYLTLNGQAFSFWSSVFTQAQLQSPRMLAALLMTLPNENLPQAEKNKVDSILSILKTIPK